MSIARDDPLASAIIVDGEDVVTISRALRRTVFGVMIDMSMNSICFCTISDYCHRGIILNNFQGSLALR